MSRSGYMDCDIEQWDLIRWRGAVKSAIRGRRGQAFLKEMLAALNALPNKRLIAKELKEGDSVCAIGAVGLRRGVDMEKLDPEDAESVAGTFGIATAMAREIVFENDDWAKETPERRFERMRAWVVGNILEEGNG